MLNSGWRTIIIDQHVSLEYEQGNMLVIGEDKKYFPIPQMKTLIINTPQARITSYLMTELCCKKVKIIFCDHQHNPISELIGYHDNCQTSGRMLDQIHWSQDDKDMMWQKIVSSKIETQNSLLIYLGFGNNIHLNKYLSEVEPGDPSNREGQAARIYFNTIFGRDFVRGAIDPLNSMLNYGYSILLSSFNRSLAAYGYHTALGMKHCSTFNPYNLSSDLMEPFRPFVDRIASKNRGNDLDKNLKKQLIGVTYSKMTYGGKQMELQTAIEEYISQIMKNMQNRLFQIPLMEFLDEG